MNLVINIPAIPPHAPAVVSLRTDGSTQTVAFSVARDGRHLHVQLTRAQATTLAQALKKCAGYMPKAQDTT